MMVLGRIANKLAERLECPRRFGKRKEVDSKEREMAAVGDGCREGKSQSADWDEVV